MLLTNPTEVVETVNRCLEAVLGWMMANKGKDNPPHVEVLLHGGLDQGIEIYPVLDGVSLPLYEQLCNLELLFDSTS